MKTMGICLAAALGWGSITTGYTQTITWKGGGDGVSWHDPLNWNGGQVPGPTNDVVISDGAGTNVVISSADTTVQSLQCAKPLTISGVGFAVTSGPSLVQGAFTMANGANLTAVGAATILTCTGSANIDGAGLNASDGAVVSLPGVSSYAKSWCDHRHWQANGTGSRIVLAGLTNLAGGCGSWTLYIQALSGGRVELGAAQALGSGWLNLLADGADSVVDLSGVASEDTANSYVVVETRNQGSVLLPQLVDGTTVDLALRSGGTVPTAQWQRLHALTLDGVAANFAALTNLAPGGTLALGNGGALTAGVLTNIDGASLSVSGGSVLSLPGVRSYAKTYCDHRIWQASGTGSRIVLAGLTNLTGGCGSWTLYVQALSGGRVELAAVPGLGSGWLNLLADGSDSVVDLSGVASEDTANSYVVVEARNQGSVLLPQLVDGATVDLTLRSGGTVPTAQWQRLHSLTLDGVAANFAALTNLAPGGTLALGSGAALTAGVLTSIDSLSLSASGGSVLSLPGVRSYAKPYCDHRTWQASGSGSRIVLAGLTNLAAGCDSWTLYVQALSGGRVELGAVQSLGSGWLNLLADGTDSVVDLSAVASADTTNSYVVVEARNQGSVLLPQLVDGATVDLALRSGGTVPAGQWQRLHSLTLDGVVANFAALTNLAPGGTLALDNGAALTAGVLTSIDSLSLYVSGGSVLSLPGVRSYAKPYCDHRIWQASGSGSRIVLAGLANLAAGCESWTLYVQALNGGRVELGAVQSLGSGWLNLLADGTDSVVDLSAVASTDTTNSYVVAEARNQGSVLLPQLVDGATVDLTLRSGGTVPAAQWQRLHSLTLDGVAANFAALTNIAPGGTLALDNGGALTAEFLTNIDSLSLYASGGSVLSLPGTRSYAKPYCDHRMWQASGTGSRIVLAGLTNLASGCEGWTLSVQALGGGQVAVTNLLGFGGGYVAVTADGAGSVVDFSRLPSLSVGATSQFSATAQNAGFVNLPSLADISGSTANFLADGNNSLIDLSHLSGFVTPLGVSSLVAQNGGGILINSQVVFLLANVTVSLPGFTLPSTPAMILHGLPWHSYLVEQQLLSTPGSWTTLARVPQISEFQTFASAPPPDTAFRVSEFIADPPILALNRATAGQIQLTLYGAPGKTYRLESASSPAVPASWDPGDTVLLTNAFRIFAPGPMADPSRFFRARQM